MLRINKAMAAAGAAVLIFTAVAGIGLGSRDTSASTLEAVQTIEAQDESFSYANVADVTEAVMPAIVAITNKSIQEVRSYFSGRGFQYESESAGSGIIIDQNDTELLICTNNHVVEGADTIVVTFIDDESYEARVKGTDPSTDLAVVALDIGSLSEDTISRIRIATVGDSESLRVGEQVVAIGNALGYGQSVTTGIVSAKGRSITIADSSGGGSFGYGFGFGYGYGSDYDSYNSQATVYEELIQTDAAINPGNSGGALLNMRGEVVGINSAKASSNGVEGMGYSIPVHKASPILENIMSKVTREKLGENEYGYLGITGESVSSQASMLYNIPSGIYVASVLEDGPAQKAGISEGDIITAFDGETMGGMEDLQNAMMYYSPGEEVTLTVYTRSEIAGGGYEEQTLTVVLGDRSALQK